jgi:hypothetical protein
VVPSFRPAYTIVLVGTDSVQNMGQEKEGLLFVNKKKQKNFVALGPCGFSASGPVSKTFLRRFF